MNELKPARVGASMARAVAVVDHMTGPTIVRLMRLHRVSIRDLASAMNVTLTRVREVREHGVRGVEFV